MGHYAHNPSLYEQVVEITAEYLGPAADRFISRQIKAHIGKEPHDLDYTDMEDLLDWVRLTISLLTEDEEVVNRYTTSLMNLGK